MKTALLPLPSGERGEGHPEAGAQRLPPLAGEARGEGPLVEQGTRASRIALAVALALAGVAATLPLWGESSSMREFVEIACYFVFAMMWNLLAGYGGMVSIGQQAFFGLGGYVMLMLGNLAGVNPFVAIPIAAVVTAIVALPVSWVAFRLQGGYFAIGTWVIAEVFRLSFANLSIVGGGSGTSLTALRGIADAGDHWRIPALVTWSEVIAADLPPLFDGLKLAAREIGGVQIQNTATVCGNLCNASPAADGIPNLLAIDARVELSSTRGRRLVPVARVRAAPHDQPRLPDRRRPLPRPRDPGDDTGAVRRRGGIAVEGLDVLLDIVGSLL